MVTENDILSVEKEYLQKAAEQLNQEDINQLVAWLSVKEDDLRYQTLQLLQLRSRLNGDVYPYWDVFCNKLKDGNSYQRSIGLTLIAENVKWDTDKKIDSAIDDYLLLLKDEKPITVRQCIQALEKMLEYVPQLEKKIAKQLMAINLFEIKETMRKLILMDILNILVLMRSKKQDSQIESYIMDALTGEILDKKAKKQLEAML
jgi:hypothetical protein